MQKKSTNEVRETRKMNYVELEGKDLHFLVTGGAGFIGSNLAEALLTAGQRVTVLDNFSTGRRANVERILAAATQASVREENFNLIEGDIREPEACRRAVTGVDFVLHNAALGSVPRSVKDPQTSAEVNSLGTLNMLVATCEARKAGTGPRRFVYASSSSVYGDSSKLPKVEGAEGNPLSPYAVTKIACELYAYNFHHLYGLETIGLRYFNVFGPMQDADTPYAAVIPIFVKKLLNDEPPTINGDGEATRDFTYVANVVEANIKACFAGKDAAAAGVYNIAFGAKATINDLYAAIAKLLGKESRPVYGPERQGDVRASLADITLARRMLGYEPQIGLTQGLELAIGWYKENL